MHAAPPTARPVTSAALALALVVAGCGGTAGMSVPVASAGPATSPGGTTEAATPVPTQAGASPAAQLTPAPSLTPVPGGQSPVGEPEPTRIPTSQTGWGEILDRLPDSFPMHPDADVADVEDGPYSGTFGLPAGIDASAGWYQEQLAARGYGVELSAPLEDGSRVLDAQADLPECRIQMSFRPAGGSTIIRVLIASACANGIQG